MKAILSLLILVVSVTACLAQKKLPRVLVIADSALRASYSIAATDLKGRAQVVVHPTDLGDTGTAISKLDKLLGDAKWDLIHFNFGFADLRHIDPKTKSVRILSRHAGGVKTTSPEEYEANLRKIVARLKETDAKLIWATTTPLVGTKYDGIFEPGSEKPYNAIAAEIMLEQEIPVNDLHAWVLGNVKKFTDPFAFKRVPIQEPIVASIEQALGIPPKPSKPAAAKKKK